MLEPILARFKDSPSLVAPEQQATFEACLGALAKLPDLPKLMAEQGSNDFWFAPDDWRSYYRPYKVSGGILTIPVKGVLLHDFPWATGWATGYEYIWQAYKRGMEDGSVRGIALHSHSPGGDVAGNFDMVDKMFAMKGRKPVRAFAHEAAYSAAYSIASVADKIVVSRTGGVGSIGVVTAHWDVSKAYEDFGVKITFIHFGKHKVDGNPFEALKPEVQARIQKRIDALGEVFVSTVARNRGMDVADVKKTEALTYSAEEAVEIGLADEVGPLDEAVAAFAADLTASEGDEQMADFTQAQYDEGVAAAAAAGKADGIKEGSTAERTRIAAILDSEVAKERPAAARMLAFDTDKDATSATAALAKLPAEVSSAVIGGGDKADNGQKFDSEMKKDQPKVGAEGSDQDKPSRAQRTSAMMGWEKTSK